MTWIVKGTKDGVTYDVQCSSAYAALSAEGDLIEEGYTNVTIEPA
jgi:hypothetical protein